MVKSRHDGFFSKMTDKELVDYIRKNYSGWAITKFLRSASRPYVLANKRGLVGALVEEGILVRQSRPKGFFKNMGDDEFLEFIRQKYGGKTISEFSKQDPSAYRQALQREAINLLIDDGTLVRAKKSNGYFTQISDEALIDYIAKNHNGRQISDFENNDSRAYTVASHRGLIDKLVEDSILRRKQRAPTFFSRMSDDGLIDYVSENFSGNTLTEFKHQCSAVYKLAHQRKLIEQLVGSGTLVRQLKRVFTEKMSDEELIQYVRENHEDNTISEFRRAKSSAYALLRKRGLIDKLVEDKILIRLKNHNIIDEGKKAEIISLLKISGKNYSELGLETGVNLSSLNCLALRLAKSGELDSSYLRPNGSLYLANVRRGASQNLESALLS